jgi:23S rRNA pseudouridine955/2504/2580 synthase
LKTLTIGANDAGQRLDKFLTKAFKNMPQSMLYKGIRTKNIKLNGKRCEISSRLNQGDVLTLYLKDEFLETGETEYDFTRAPATLDIVYEDENILLLNKKPGLIVHTDENYHFD